LSLREGNLCKSIDLRDYTAIKIGGRAKYFWAVRDVDNLSRILNTIGSNFYLLGGGSNLLVKDSLIKRPVIKLGESFNFIRREGVYIAVGASTMLSSLMKYCLQHNLSGLENLAGIPATLGGLLAMNGAAFGRGISEVIVEVDIMDRQGSVKTLKKEEITFGYRYSSLQDYIILEAKLALAPEDIKTKVSDFLDRRFTTQDFSLPSCGCIFKNPSDSSAGFLIDSCGFKGLKRGGAQVSLRHANFIVNLGPAKCRDVDYLIRKIKGQIYEKYSIILQEEIKRWD
jgi:UDP-N-acetylmuramate dehydrogenase